MAQSLDITLEPTGTWRDRARLWLLRLSLIYLGLLVLLYVVEETIAERSWVTLLMTYVFQDPLLAPALVLLFASLLLRHWRATAANVVAVIFVLVGFMGIAHPPSRS